MKMLFLDPDQGAATSVCAALTPLTLPAATLASSSSSRSSSSSGGGGDWQAHPLVPYLAPYSNPPSPRLPGLGAPLPLIAWEMLGTFHGGRNWTRTTLPRDPESLAAELVHFGSELSGRLLQEDGTGVGGVDPGISQGNY